MGGNRNLTEEKKILDFKKIFKNLNRAIDCAKRDKEELKRLEGLGLRLRKTERVAKKRYRGEKLTGKDIKESQVITCFGNLGYCCSLKKPCIKRDACREALGIGANTYINTKEKVANEILEKE